MPHPYDEDDDNDEVRQRLDSIDCPELRSVTSATDDVLYLVLYMVLRRARSAFQLYRDSGDSGNDVAERSVRQAIEYLRSNHSDIWAEMAEEEIEVDGFHVQDIPNCLLGLIDGSLNGRTVPRLNQVATGYLTEGCVGFSERDFDDEDDDGDHDPELQAALLRSSEVHPRSGPYLHHATADQEFPYATDLQRMSHENRDAALPTANISRGCHNATTSAPRDHLNRQLEESEAIEQQSGGYVASMHDAHTAVVYRFANYPLPPFSTPTELTSTEPTMQSVSGEEPARGRVSLDTPGNPQQPKKARRGRDLWKVVARTQARTQMPDGGPSHPVVEQALNQQWKAMPTKKKVRFNLIGREDHKKGHLMKLDEVRVRAEAEMDQSTVYQPATTSQAHDAGTSTQPSAISHPSLAQAPPMGPSTQVPVTARPRATQALSISTSDIMADIPLRSRSLLSIAPRPRWFLCFICEIPRDTQREHIPDEKKCQCCIHGTTLYGTETADEMRYCLGCKTEQRRRLFFEHVDDMRGEQFDFCVECR